eukprot:920258_1
MQLNHLPMNTICLIIYLNDFVAKPFVAMMSYWLLWADLIYRIIRTMVSTRPKHDAPSTASGTNTFPIEELIIGACSFYSIYCYQRYFRIQTLLNYYLSTGRDSLLFW